MKKMILIIALLTMPFMSFSQNDIDTQNVTSREVITSVIEFDLDATSNRFELDDQMISYRKIEPISMNPKDQNKNINFKKSNDLISIKAYIKSLQMKRKTTLMT